MKKILVRRKFIAGGFLVFCALIFSASVFSQTPVLHFSFVSHNEESDFPQYNSIGGRINYLNKVALIKQFSDSVKSKNAAYDFQSDWRFLDATIKFDTGTQTTTTANKNIIRYIAENDSIEVDVHAHESMYKKADVAHLIDSCGVIPSGIIGGFFFDAVVNGNDWQDYETCHAGTVFPSHQWCPDAMWGGASGICPPHQCDLSDYGIWKPQSMQNFYTHDASKHLVCIGNGCENLLHDTVPIAQSWQIVKDFIVKMENHQVPSYGFYTTRFMFNIRDLTPTLITEMNVLMDSIQPYVNSGLIKWSTLSETLNDWNNAPFQFACDSVWVSNSIEETATDENSLFTIFPNPSDENFTISINKNLLADGENYISVTDVRGKEIYYHAVKGVAIDKILLSKTEMNLTQGLYFVKLKTAEKEVVKKMVVF